jgi:hypothetical protein
MQVGEDTDIDGINILSIQEAPVVIEKLRDPESVRKCLGTLFCPGRYRQNFNL